MKTDYKCSPNLLTLVIHALPPKFRLELLLPLLSLFSSLLRMSLMENGVGPEVGGLPVEENEIRPLVKYSLRFPILRTKLALWPLRNHAKLRKV